MKKFAFLFIALALNTNVYAQNTTEVLGLNSKLSYTGASYILPISIGIIFLILAGVYFWYMKINKK